MIFLKIVVFWVIEKDADWCWDSNGGGGVSPSILFDLAMKKWLKHPVLWFCPYPPGLFFFQKKTPF